MRGKPPWDYTLQRHNTENFKQIFPEKELLRLSPNFHIHVYVNNLYIPTIGLPILLQENMWTNPKNICINRSQTHWSANWDWGRAVPFLGVHKWDFRCSANKTTSGRLTLDWFNYPNSLAHFMVKTLADFFAYIFWINYSTGAIITITTNIFTGLRSLSSTVWNFLQKFEKLFPFSAKKRGKGIR